MPNFNEIPLFPRSHYEVDVDWSYLPKCLERYTREYHLDLNPDFQRAHVWTEAQQRAYVEYRLRGGEVGQVIVFNHPHWRSGKDGVMEVVDGKQRLEAACAFLRGDLAVFGHKFSEWTGHLNSNVASFKFRVVELSNRADLYQLYLNINAGGTPHSQEELDKVRTMLARTKGVT